MAEAQHAGGAKVGGKIPPPRIDRSYTLHMRGDWGRFNLHRSLGWIGYELSRLSGPHMRFAIWSGSGAIDSLRAVGRGEVDIAFVVPEPLVRMVLDGYGLAPNERYPHVRALGYVPQNDRLLFAVRKELGLTSFADIRAKKPKLRLTTGPDDGISFIGIGAKHLLQASGLTRDDILAWGGSILDYDEPHEHTGAMVDGRADAVITEAIMTPYWRHMAETLDLTFIPVEPEASAVLQRDMQWATSSLPAGYVPGITQELPCMDFSHFLLLTTDALPDDIAYGIAWCMVEKWEGIEAQYRHLKPERSPITYPLNPKAICRTTVPLHQGAERYYRDAGHLD